MVQGARAAMIAHARDEAPNECCGMAVGHDGLILEAVRMRNVAVTPATRYRIDPAEHIALNRRLRGSPRAIIGAYHSHPRGGLVPSATDRAEALYPQFVWLIVSLAGASGEVAAFMLSDGSVRQLPIVVERRDG
jgi:proteasome lid subunit RPN8/RPN11